MMMNKELTLDERNNDLWDKGEGSKYAIIIMYSVSTSSEARFITSMPLNYDKALVRMEAMLNDWEQGRAVCLNSHFVNPNNIVLIKMDVWKDKTKSRFDGEFYE